jgi:hypothetical protein
MPTSPLPSGIEPLLSTLGVFQITDGSCGAFITVVSQSVAT